MSCWWLSILSPTVSRRPIVLCRLYSGHCVSSSSWASPKYQVKLATISMIWYNNEKNSMNFSRELIDNVALDTRHTECGSNALPLLPCAPVLMCHVILWLFSYNNIYMCVCECGGVVLSTLFFHSLRFLICSNRRHLDHCRHHSWQNIIRLHKTVKWSDFVYNNTILWSTSLLLLLLYLFDSTKCVCVHTPQSWATAIHILTSSSEFFCVCCFCSFASCFLLLASCCSRWHWKWRRKPSNKFSIPMDRE